MKNDIQTTEDIKQLVDAFYEKVNADQLLAPVFNAHANVNWDAHLPKMYAFWGTQLIGTGNYSGRPFPPHMDLPIGKEHFAMWLTLFIETVDENFSGAVADIAKQKALNIAAVFQHKLEMLR